MRRRHLTTAVTLLVLVGILVAGVILGVRSLLAPIPEDGSPTANPGPTCTTKSVREGQRIRSRQVQVSVFNGGSRVGLAGSTLSALAKRGFRRGEAGNAPEGTRVRRVQVWTVERHDVAARLVARQFGRSTVVRVTRTDLGPGIDVVVGDGLDGLVRARRVVVVKRSASICVPARAQRTATPAG
jgi:hypothetical protein